MTAHHRFKQERGQAIAEFVVIMIPLLMIFTAAWFVLLVGRDKGLLFLENRRDTEQDALNAATTGGADHITGWDYGKDEIPFSGDDEVIYGGVDEAAFFSSQLNAEKLSVNQIQHMLKYNLNHYIASPIFAMGAELCMTSKSRPMLESAGEDKSVIIKLVKNLFGKDVDIPLEEKVYYPAMRK